MVPFHSHYNSEIHILFCSFLFCCLFCFTSAHLKHSTRSLCPNNCICSERDVTCTGADYDEIMSFVEGGGHMAYKIRDTPIPHLTTQFQNVTIIVLELSNCQIETIDENFFENYTHLYSLNLDYNYLTEIPRLGNLWRLMAFSAKGNMISKVSPELFTAPERFRRLESVDLSHNALRDIEFLKPIEEMVYSVDLSHNFYTNISMSNYPDLKSLDLSYNLFRKENAIELNVMPNLISLNLTGNMLSTLDVLNLTDVPVKHLDLRQNHLSSTLDFTNFTSLTELILDDNQLATLPVFPETLEKLYLNNNKLEGDLIFPENNLTKIQLNGNKITSKNDDAFIKIKKESDTMQNTTMSVNNVTKLPPGMYEVNFRLVPLMLVVPGQ